MNMALANNVLIYCRIRFCENRSGANRAGLSLLTNRVIQITIIYLVFQILPAFITIANSATDLPSTETSQSEMPPATGETGEESPESVQDVIEAPLLQDQPDTELIQTETPIVVAPEEIAVKEETRARERDAGEDPLAQNLSEKTDLPERQLFRPNKLELYGSVRVRYLATDFLNEVNDGGSRFGLNGELQFHPKFWLLGRVEAGLNLLGTLDEVFDNTEKLGDGDNIKRRLIYTAVETPSTIILYGKNWSTYYQVAGITDRFQSFGADASGTFNAQTDGGATGTGRADNVLQSRIAIDFLPEKLKIKPFNLHLQAQPGQSIPDTDGVKYKYSFGLSGTLETEGEFNLGIAYNQAVVDNDDLPALRLKGITGDARALVMGTRVFGDKIYIATTVAFLENHETTDEGIYFDGWGWEVFSSYELFKNWWAIGGLNTLEPYKDQLRAKEYRIRYGVLGLRYSFDAFRQMLYTEIRLDNSLSAAGERLGNVYTVGVRWDLP